MKPRYDEVQWNAGFYEIVNLIYGYMAPVVNVKNLIFKSLLNSVWNNWFDLCNPNIGAHSTKSDFTYTIWGYGIFSMCIIGFLVDRKFNG